MINETLNATLAAQAEGRAMNVSECKRDCLRKWFVEIGFIEMLWLPYDNGGNGSCFCMIHNYYRSHPNYTMRYYNMRSPPCMNSTAFGNRNSKHAKLFYYDYQYICYS